jgi:uncharacterized membrane protein
MALMSQLFHQSGLLYQLFFIWGLGVLVMAYSLRLTLLGILAILLIGLGYLQGQPEFVAIGEFSWLRLMVQHMPVLAALLFIPLAYWCHSRWIFRLGAIAIVYSLEANLIRLNLLGSSAWMAAIACALPPALLWGYSDSLFRRRPPEAELFTGVARTLAVIFLSLLFYFLSFYGLWWDTSSTQPTQNASLLPWSLLVDILLFGCWTLWEWLRLLRQLNLTTGIIAGMIVLSALVPFWHLSISRLPITAVLIFNLLLFVLSVGLIREGLAQGQRRLFWGGMILLSLQIFSRMLEYNTDLLFKSLVLFLCGLGVIAAGLWFERYVKTRN